MTSTTQAISAVAVRVIGWLVILSGIKSFLSVVLLSMMYAFVAATTESHAAVPRSHIPTVVAAVTGIIEVTVGCLIIARSKSLGRLLSRGLDESS